MVRNDAGSLKRQRLKDIKIRIAQTISKGVSLEKVLDWCEMEIGLTRKTANQYVKLINRVNGWIINSEGVIVANM